MTLVVGLKYPQFIEDMNVSEYWDAKEVSISDIAEAIILVGDSRVSNSIGEHKDIAQKISQLSLDLMMGYAGNVRLAEEVYKSIHFRLNEKKKYYDGLDEIIQIFEEIIHYKKRHLEKHSSVIFETDFFLCTVDNDNVPVMYSFKAENDYKGVKELEDDFYSCIGQNIYDQEALIVEIKKSILESKNVKTQLEEKELISLSILDVSIFIRNGYREFLKKTEAFPSRITVGGPIPAMSIKPHPECIELLNEWIYNPDTGKSYTMHYNIERNSWEEKSDEGIKELHVYPSDKFYR